VLQPTRVTLRTADRASLRAQRLRDLFADSATDDGPVEGAVGHATEDHRAVNAQASIEKPVANKRGGSQSRAAMQERYSLWGWSHDEGSPASPSRNRVRTSGRTSPMSLQNYIPQSSALFPGHPCSPRRDSSGDIDGKIVPRSAGNYTRKLIVPVESQHRDSARHNIPYITQDESVLRYTMAMVQQNPNWIQNSSRRTARSRHRTATSRTLNEADHGYDADSSIRSPARTATDGAQHLEHTFASRKKKCGTGPLMKNAIERQYLLSRSATAEPELNLDEVPDKWIVKQEMRAARREASEWDRILRYKEPKPHGGKRVMFQSALRNAIGPRMEIKLRTYDNLKHTELMEASQLFVPPRYASCAYAVGSVL